MLTIKPARRVWRSVKVTTVLKVIESCTIQYIVYGFGFLAISVFL